VLAAATAAAVNCHPFRSLQELSQLFIGLASSCSDAAGWLLGVGLTWATTCHLDMGQEGSWFSEAGVWLLKAAVVASPQLAGNALAKVLQQLTAGALWSAGRCREMQVHKHGASCKGCILMQRNAVCGQMHAVPQIDCLVACCCILHPLCKIVELLTSWTWWW
jgi:hypothetical protein